MTSRLSTPDEGEIVESGSEKANLSLPSVNGKIVDRPSRTKSPSSPPPKSRRQEHRSRSRSRSPYRASRGSKRSREDDHYNRSDRHDPRSFKVHYESRRDGDRDQREYERGGRSRVEEKYPVRSRDKRQRTESRSPPRFNERKRDQKVREQNSRQSNGGTVGGRAERYTRDQSVNEDRGRSPALTASSKEDAEQKLSQTATQNSLGGKKSGASTFVSGQSNKQSDMVEEPLDEAAMIEQRRKRREAIKAKHRGQATPLMKQALNASSTSSPLSTSATPGDTPGTTTGSSFDSLLKSSDASKLTPPGSPRELSGPSSPATLNLTNDADLANPTIERTTDEDGPSAADYDPTMDMEEDRKRHESHQESEVSAKTYDETTNDNQDILVPKEMPAKDGFDMFADDDMFAEDQSMNAEDSGPGNVPIPKAKALDMSMLDDWDDHEGYYKIILGELLDGRYHVQANLGRGMFSAVVRAQDEITGRLVAIKIIRANDSMRKAAAKEISILETLRDADAEDKKHMIRLERDFEHKGHLCMVFEHLSINLREVLKKFGRDVGINLKAVRAYAQQMFLGLSLMRKCNILHADLKPDNILVNESRNVLKICDLGSASDASENDITPYLVSRFYRAPEIILGVQYDFAIDMWSVGCTLFELYTGKILFTGRTNNQMLRSIMECRGKFGHKTLRKAEFAHLHFDDLLNFRSVEKDKISGKDTIRMLTFNKPTRDLRSRLQSNAKGLADVDMKEINLFADLLEKCLVLNPEKRITPVEALKHPFILRPKA